MSIAKMVTAVSLAMCIAAWVAFAEHPNARSMRKAIVSALPFV